MSRLDRMYYSMKQRCYNYNSPAYELYGGRGITVCDEWLNNPQAFFDWANANGFEENKRGYDNSIDRIDNDRGYFPDNCRFVNANVQNSNRRVPNVAKDGSGRLLTNSDSLIIQKRYTRWKYGRGIVTGGTRAQCDAMTKLAFFEDLQEKGKLIIADQPQELVQSGQETGVRGVVTGSGLHRRKISPHWIGGGLYFCV